MNSTLAALINIPLLFLVYIMMYFTQALSGKRQFYGVSLNSDYFTKEEFKNLDKKYKLLTTIGFFIFTLITLITIYKFKAYITASIVPVLGFCLYQFIVFIYIHNQVKALKKELSLEIKDIELEKTKMILDTDFLNEKNKIVKKYSILCAVPLVITLLVCIYTASQYNSMPDIIPTHWGISGKPDAYSQKSFFSVFGIIFMSLLSGLIIYISSISSLKTRAKLNTDNIDESKKLHLNYLNNLSIAFLLLNLGLQLLFIETLIATVNSSNINLFTMIFATILLIGSAIYQVYLYYKSPSKYKSAVYSIDDNDDNWLFGSIYNNPNDPSLFVQKRFGVGWTVNIGNTKGKLFFFSPFIIVIVVLIITFNM
ncbi:MAG: DUF1648 domain-containing protein [Romboutsia sp.]|nr:DUF1648 domain-containing protein [Romboutsia sp.]